MTSAVVRLGQYYEQRVVDIDGEEVVVLPGQYYGQLFAGDTQVVPGQLYDQLVLADEVYVEDAAATTLFAAMSTEPTQARKVLYNNLISGLKADDNWDALDVLYLFAAHDADDALINIKDPGTFDATLTDAPVFTEDAGYTTDGIDDNISTFNPSTAGGNFVQNSACWAYWSLTADQVGAASGADAANGDTFLNSRNTSDQQVARITMTSNLTVSSVTDGRGLPYVNRSASNAIQTGKNGAQTGSATTASAAIANATLTLGMAGASFGACQFAACYAGASRTEAQHLQIYNRLLAYLQGVGAV